MRSPFLAIVFASLKKNCWWLCSIMGFVLLISYGSTKMGQSHQNRMILLEHLKHQGVNVERQYQHAQSRLCKTYYKGFLLMAFDTCLLIICLYSDPQKRILRFPPRLYTLPVTTRKLVFSMMGISVTWAFLVMFLATLCFNLTSGRSLSLLAWPLFTALVLAMGEAFCWSVGEVRLYHVPILGAIVLALFLWVDMQHGSTGFNNPQKLWTHLSFGQLGFLVGGIVVSYSLAVLGVGHNRKGGNFLKFEMERETIKAGKHSATERKPYRSSLEAQCRFEWRKVSFLIPLAVVLCIPMWIVYFDEGSRNSFNIHETWNTFLLFVLILGPYFVGALVTKFPRQGEGIEIGSFIGAKPLADSELARARLTTGAFCLGVTVCIILFNYQLMSLVGGRGHAEDLCRMFPGGGLLGDMNSYQLFAIFFLGITGALWSLLGIWFSIFQTGRRWFIVMEAIVFFMIIFGGLFFIHPVYDLPYFAQEVLKECLPGILGVIILYVFWRAYAACWKRGLLKGKAIQVAIFIWFLGVLLTFYLVSSMGIKTMKLFLASLALPTLIVTPPALATLSTSWNRHR